MCSTWMTLMTVEQMHSINTVQTIHCRGHFRLNNKKTQTTWIGLVAHL